ncbi:MAG: hypothetical protein HBSAPP02_05800 [Phycisphaerae bacterium]|nr:MAG: hypothetical protein DCC66_09795 [Planctomycetota bacterium]GJQ25548.1 MAG: hypothetical protein HBSAPP02_05800 [Phycisphaerae bacterium]
MWWKALVIMGMLVCGGVSLGTALAARARRARYRAALQAWRAATPDRRSTAMASVPFGPDRAVAWFLLGVDWLRAGRMVDAARAFGMAHHADWALESAALLTYTCLKSRDEFGETFLRHLSNTWSEMRQPALGARAAEQLVLEGLADEGDEPAQLSTLGRVAWRVGPPGTREALKRIAAGTVELEDWAKALRAG